MIKFWVLLGVMVVGLLLLLLLGALLAMSGRLAQQEREDYYRQNGRWPEW
jgi:uncharacterized BrkB/YihY/UPF0761 family membrane protein